MPPHDGRMLSQRLYSILREVESAMATLNRPAVPFRPPPSLHMLDRVASDLRLLAREMERREREQLTP